MIYIVAPKLSYALVWANQRKVPPTKFRYVHDKTGGDKLRGLDKPVVVLLTHDRDIEDYLHMIDATVIYD